MNEKISYTNLLDASIALLHRSNLEYWWVVELVVWCEGVYVK